jgi:hypothetical protein
MEPVEAKIVRKLKREIAVQEEFRLLFDGSELGKGLILGLRKAIEVVEEDAAN